MGSVAVGAMVVGTSMLVVFALAMATLEQQVDNSLAELENAAEPIPGFTIEDATNVEGAVVSFTINNGGTGYGAGQVEVNGSAGSFLADLVVTLGVVTGLDIIDHGSSYLYTSTYYLELTGPNIGSSLNITATLGNIVYTNITNTGSVDLNTEHSWVFSDGSNPHNLSDDFQGYLPETIFPGETYTHHYYSDSQSTVTRIAVSNDGVTKVARVV
jgi:hypothetical protein